MKKLRVGIDGRLIMQNKIGTGVYTDTIRSAVRILSPADIDLEVFDEFYSRRCGYRWFRSLGRRSVRKMGYFVWLNSYFPMFLRRQRIDVLHAPNIIPPFVKVCPTVITIHDLGLLLHPEYYDRRYQQVMALLIPRACEVADAIIVPSAYVRSELERTLGVDPGKVAVIHESARSEFAPVRDRAEIDRVRRRFDLPTRFLLSVGQLTARKNLKLLVDVFAEVCRRLDDRALGLVVVGRDDGEQAMLEARSRRLGVGERVKFLGYVGDAELAGLYHLAAAFVFPSLYEGFGIPPLEAMSCGTPVVASNRTALPEVVGDGGLLLDPASGGEWVAALCRLLTDPGQAGRLGRAGLERARLFTVERFGRQTLDVYRRAAG